MDLDLRIKADIEKTEQEKPFPWIKSIVDLEADQMNPFILPDSFHIMSNQEIVKSKLGHLFCQNHCHMTVDFPDETALENVLIEQNEQINEMRHRSKTTLASEFVNKQKSKRIDLNQTFRLSSIGSITDAVNDLSIGNHKSIKLALVDFKCGIDAIGPMYCSAFLFHKKLQKRITETWNFIPPNFTGFYDLAQITVECNLSAQFVVEPSIIDQDVVLFITMSHPTTNDNGSAQTKYYLERNEKNKNKALEEVNAVFPRIPQAFSVFGYTFADASVIRRSKENITLPDIYRLTHPVRDSEILNLISEVETKKVKQYPFKLTIGNGRQEGDIIRSLHKFKALPNLAPVHQLFVQFDNIALKIPRNIEAEQIIISIELINVETGQSYECIHSKHQKNKLDKIGYSRCFAKEKNPYFDDTFVIDLPYPLTSSMVLQFKVYNLSTKKNAKPLSQFATCSLGILNGESFIEDKKYTLFLDFFTQIPPEDEKHNMFSLSTYLSSNLIFTDPQINSFVREIIDTGNITDFEINKLPTDFVINHLEPMIDSLINNFDSKPMNAIDGLLSIQNKLCEQMELRRFEKYLMIYARYFAFDKLPEESDSNLINHVRASSSFSSMFLIDESLDETQSVNIKNQGEFLKQFATKELVGQQPFYARMFHTLTQFLLARPIQQIKSLINFFFTMIIKSLKMLHPTELGETFNPFLAIWSKSIANHPDVEVFSQAFGLFVNLLFDIGYASQAANAIILQINTFSKSTYGTPALISLVEFSFRPTLVYFSLINIIDFQKMLINLTTKAVNNKDLVKVFKVLLRIISCLDDEMSEKFASTLIESVWSFTPNQPSLPVIIYFMFLIGTADFQSIVSHIGIDKRKANHIFKVIHTLLSQMSENFLIENLKQHTKIPQINNDEKLTRNSNDSQLKIIGTLGKRTRRNTIKKESIKSLPIPEQHAHEIVNINTITDNMIFKAYHNTIQFMEKMMKDITLFEELFKLWYHLLCASKKLDMFTIMVEMFLTETDNVIRAIFYNKSVSLVKVIQRLFIIASKDKVNHDLILKFFNYIAERDRSFFKSSKRSDFIFLRALSLFEPIDIVETNFKELLIKYNDTKLLKILQTAEQIVAAKTREKRNELLIQRTMDFSQSPDALFTSLDLLFKNTEGENERINILVTQAALVIECLTLYEKVPPFYSSTHPSSEFSVICSDVIKIDLQRDNDLFGLPGYCDSIFFSELGFQSLLDKIINLSESYQLYDPMFSLIDLLMPIFEFRRSYFEANYFFKKFSVFAEKASFEPPFGSDSMIDRYFAVSFYGSVFGEDDTKTFIYRTKRLTHLYAFSPVILKRYQEAYGDSVTLWSESGQIDLEKLDKDKNYIQIVFVEPKKKSELEGIGKVTMRKQFFYDTPFIPGSKKLQGSVEEQWIRRTVLTTAYELPSLLERSVVSEVRNIEYEPILVARHQLYERIQMMTQAVQDKDYSQIQQLLHGSVLVQVNEGPAKVAEVFLKGEKTKEKERLMVGFKSFLLIIQKSLKLHGEWVTNNQDFLPMQVQLEEGYEQLRTSLTKYFSIYNSE